MTQDKQRVSIAEWMGWEWRLSNESKTHGWAWFRPDKQRWSGIYYDKRFKSTLALHSIPNYPNDLNACHEFEGKFSPLDHQKFCLFLHKQIMGTMDNFDINGTCNLECISRVVKATAAQRSEAFCRMMFPDKFKS